MKTVKDVMAAYPDGWPVEDNYIIKGHYIISITHVFKHIGKPELETICTREEYEQELARTNTDEWYDYDKQEAIGLPPVGVECEYTLGYSGVWWKCKVQYVVGCEGIVMKADHLGNEQYCSIYDLCRELRLRPLDYDKNKKKVVDLDWLIDSSIDCEFSELDSSWYIGKLQRLADDTRPYHSANGENWTKLRPRMNHKMVLTDDQLKLIPEGFKYDIEQTHTIRMVYNIVEFIGMAEGYIYPYEKTATQQS